MSGSANKHAKLSPSSSKRWLNCTASIAYSDANPRKEKEGSYAAEGTQAHDYSEEILEGLLSLEEIPESFRKPVGFYVNHCEEISLDCDDFTVEAVVPLFYSPTDTGTCDFVGWNDSKLFIRDLKYGQGILVRAEENTQLAIYAMSWIEEQEDIQDEMEVSIGIVQPRYSGEDPVSTWELTVGELRTFCEKIDSTAKAIVAAGIDYDYYKDLSPADLPDPNIDGTFNLEDGLCFDTTACQFCPMDGNCAAQARLSLDLLPDLDNIDPKKETSTDPEWRLKVFTHAAAIKKFVDKVCERMTDEALDGSPVPGTKLVQGRMGNTKWVDEEAAERYLARTGLKKDERFNLKLISPTQAKKLDAIQSKMVNTRSKNILDSLITRAEGKPTLALEGDKRPALEDNSEMLPDLD